MQLREASISCLSTALLKSLVELCCQLTASEEALLNPRGFVVVNVQIPCVKGYNEDQIVIVMDDPNMKECPVLLGTPTIYCVMPVIKESEINQLAIPWATS